MSTSNFSSITGAEFARMACASDSFWLMLQDERVEHKGWGVGKVTSVELRNGAGPLVAIKFREDRRAGDGNYNWMSFSDGHFSRIFLSEKIEQAFTEWELKREIAQDLINRLANEKNKIQEQAEELLLSTNAEKEKKRAFLLKVIEMGSVLNQEEKDWLKANSNFDVLAAYYELRYDDRSGRPSDLVMACKYLRKAGMYEWAVAISDPNMLYPGRVSNKKEQAMLLTTRGGALKDLELFSEARDAGELAVKTFPGTHYAHSLLWSVYNELGESELAQKNYDLAVNYGGRPSLHSGRTAQKKKPSHDVIKMIERFKERKNMKPPSNHVIS